MSRTSSCWPEWPVSCSITLSSWWVHGLSFYQASLGLARLSHCYLYPCILAVSCRLTDFLWPCGIDEGVKKASGKTRYRPCNASAVTSVMTSSSSNSHLPMATFPSSQELQSLLLLLYCAASWNGACFISQQENSTLLPASRFSCACEPVGNQQRHWTLGELLITTHHTHKRSTLQALKMEDC